MKMLSTESLLARAIGAACAKNGIPSYRLPFLETEATWRHPETIQCFNEKPPQGEAYNKELYHAWLANASQKQLFPNGIENDRHDAFQDFVYKLRDDFSKPLGLEYLK